MEYLNATGEVVTATECARMVGLSPSATSYHLRELAKYGLVEQAPSRGDGRERVWRSTTGHLYFARADGEPETHAAERALIDLYINRDIRRLHEWLDRRDQDSSEWREAGAIMGSALLLTVDELERLVKQVRELMEPYQMRTRRADPPSGAREVRASYIAFPLPSSDSAKEDGVP